MNYSYDKHTETSEKWTNGTKNVCRAHLLDTRAYAHMWHVTQLSTFQQALDANYRMSVDICRYLCMVGCAWEPIHRMTSPCIRYYVHWLLSPSQNQNQTVRENEIHALKRTILQRHTGYVLVPHIIISRTTIHTKSERVLAHRCVVPKERVPCRASTIRCTLHNAYYTWSLEYGLNLHLEHISFWHERWFYLFGNVGDADDVDDVDDVGKTAEQTHRGTIDVMHFARSIVFVLCSSTRMQFTFTFFWWILFTFCRIFLSQSSDSLFTIPENVDHLFADDALAHGCLVL